MTDEDLLKLHQALFQAALEELPNPLAGVDLSDPSWRSDHALVAKRDRRYGRAENLATERLRRHVTTHFGEPRWREFRDRGFMPKKRRRSGSANLGTLTPSR